MNSKRRKVFATRNILRLLVSIFYLLQICSGWQLHVERRDEKSRECEIYSKKQDLISRLIFNSDVQCRSEREKAIREKYQSLSRSKVRRENMGKNTVEPVQSDNIRRRKRRANSFLFQESDRGKNDWFYKAKVGHTIALPSPRTTVHSTTNKDILFLRHYESSKVLELKRHSAKFVQKLTPFCFLMVKYIGNHDFNTVRLQGTKAKSFLAMDFQGKLYTTHNHEDLNTLFTHRNINGYDEYVSRKYKFFLYLRKNGKRSKQPANYSRDETKFLLSRSSFSERTTEFAKALSITNFPKVSTQATTITSMPARLTSMNPSKKNRNKKNRRRNRKGKKCRRKGKKCRKRRKRKKNRKRKKSKSRNTRSVVFEYNFLGDHRYWSAEFVQNQRDFKQDFYKPLKSGFGKLGSSTHARDDT